MSNPLDPFWQYSEPEDGINKMKLSCKLCGKKLIGVVRFPSHDIVGCDRTSLKNIKCNEHNNIKNIIIRLMKGQRGHIPLHLMTNQCI